jgi:hypothetical protein
MLNASERSKEHLKHRGKGLLGGLLPGLEQFPVQQLRMSVHERSLASLDGHAVHRLQTIHIARKRDWRVI